MKSFERKLVKSELNEFETTQKPTNDTKPFENLVNNWWNCFNKRTIGGLNMNKFRPKYAKYLIIGQLFPKLLNLPLKIVDFRLRSKFPGSNFAEIHMFEIHANSEFFTSLGPILHEKFGMFVWNFVLST